LSPAPLALSLGAMAFVAGMCGRANGKGKAKGNSKGTGKADRCV
jgi:hypothetical protein